MDNKYHVYGYVNGANKKITPYSKLICSRGYCHKVLYFPEGYENQTEMELVFDESTNPAVKISSTNASNIRTLYLDPRMVAPDYKVEVDDEDRMVINLDRTDKLVVLTPVITCINTIAKEKTFLVKLSEPIMINTDNFFARRLLLSDHEDLRVPSITKLSLLA